VNYSKRIVCDFDDTLSFTNNRDWENATPNTKLIDKLNKLHDTGWIIDIFTARGSISCPSRADAIVEYRPGIEKWLNKHGVKYNNISFLKPLAAYYIDDKSITPDDFLDVMIEQLEGGLSGSDIYTDGDLVHKTDSNSYEVVEWFEVARKYDIKVPVVPRVISTSISMEYIDHNKKYFDANMFSALGHIQQALTNMKKINVQKVFTFDSYVKRIAEHTEVQSSEVAWRVYMKLMDMKNKNPLKQTFSHGDFGITNMLFNESGLTLIDPIPYTFGCTELDIAKFIASLMINNYRQDYIKESMSTLCMWNNVDEKIIKLFVGAELIRVLKYLNDKKKYDSIINKISLLLISIDYVL